jgi:hypothetical protein
MEGIVLVSKLRLLNAVGLAFGTNQGIEDRQNVPAVLDHSCENPTKLRLALRIFMPFFQHGSGNGDVPAQLFRGMSTQEQPVKKRGFPLRKTKIRNHLGRQHGSNSRHRENAVYPKSLLRQVGQGFFCRQGVTRPSPACNG